MAFIWVPSFFHPARTLSLSPHAGTHKELNSRARLTKKRSKHKHTYAHPARALRFRSLAAAAAILVSSPLRGIGGSSTVVTHAKCAGAADSLTGS